MTKKRPACSKCGAVHQRCKAHSRTNKPCGSFPVKGQEVCRMHGGSAPQAVAKAEERILEKGAADAVAKLWPGLASASPVKDPVDQMERLAGALTTMLDEVGTKVNELSHVSAGTSLTQLRGELVLLDKVTGHLRALLADMARLGIAERHVELEQERAQMVTAAFLAAIAVIQLLPADRDLVVRTFLDQLGQATAVPGEVA